MNTQKRVNERIAKVALKNQKVELSLVSDLSSALGEASRWESEIKSMGTSADKYINESILFHCYKIKRLLIRLFQFTTKWIKMKNSFPLSLEITRSVPTMSA